MKLSTLLINILETSWCCSICWVFFFHAHTHTQTPKWADITTVESFNWLKCFAYLNRVQPSERHSIEREKHSFDRIFLCNAVFNSIKQDAKKIQTQTQSLSLYHSLSFSYKHTASHSTKVISWHWYSSNSTTESSISIKQSVCFLLLLAVAVAVVVCLHNLRCLVF